MVERATTLALWWVLGTFHSATLVALLVRFAYPGGGLQFPLSSLNTLAGLALYLVLWATTLFTTKRALAGLDWLSDRPTEMGAFYGRALRWGAANGLVFFVVIGIAQFVNVVAAGGALTIQAVMFGTLFVASFGSAVASVIGGLIGVALGALDIAALRVARSLTRPRDM